MKLKVSVEINSISNTLVEDVIEINEKDTAGMDDEEREDYLRMLFEEWLYENINSGYEVVE